MAGQTCKGFVTLILLWSVSVSSGFAEDPRETVYFTGPNSQISEIDPLFSRAAPLVTDQGMSFQGIVVRDDQPAIRILVANATQGGGILIYDASDGTGSQIVPFPGAASVALDSVGNLFAVNAAPGGPDRVLLVPRDVGCPADPTPVNPPDGCLPGGYGGPPQGILIDTDVSDADELADVQFVAVTANVAFDANGHTEKRLRAGDIVILARKPAMVLRYRKEDIEARILDPTLGDAEPDVVIPTTAFGNLEPTGFVFAPDGDLLINTWNGIIARFSPAGERKPDFAALPGNGAKISIGLQGGENKVFVAVHNNGVVQRYGFVSRNGTEVGELEAQLTTGVNAPVGIGNGTLTGAVLTPVGRNTTISLAANEITFEEVLVRGLTSGRVFTFPDPRPAGQDLLYLCKPDGLNNPVGFECRAGAGDYVVDLGLPGVIPPYVRPLPQDGEFSFLLFVMSTSVQFEKTAELHGLEEQLGFIAGPHECNADFDFRPRFFYAPETHLGEPPIVENPLFTDITSGCGSHIGRGWRFSTYLTARDTRPIPEVVDFKLQQLEAVLNGIEDLSRKDRRELARKLDAVSRHLKRGGTEAAVREMDDFVSIAKRAVSSVQAGELIARAESLAFFACGATTSCNRLLVPQQ